MAFVFNPDRFVFEDYWRRDDKQIMVDWLSAVGPDHWHAFVDLYNWDGGIDLLASVTEQPECDRATVQLIFLRSEASYHLLDREKFEAATAKPGTTFQLILAMLRRWRSGFYTRAELGLDEHARKHWPTATGHYQELARTKWEGDHDLLLPNDFLTAAEGRLPNSVSVFDQLPQIYRERYH
jgi:hypothetical protein